ncbi:hypothetical protein M8818_006772 [Zalaria obscura]|uniref:Uncharacterized protein n=1 Tax=Zalaria obscura TaxID=2024903 RepID=A0ACC3S5Z8_9PEZI
MMVQDTPKNSAPAPELAILTSKAAHSSLLVVRQAQSINAVRSRVLGVASQHSLSRFHYVSRVLEHFHEYFGPLKQPQCVTARVRKQYHPVHGPCQERQPKGCSFENNEIHARPCWVTQGFEKQFASN